MVEAKIKARCRFGCRAGCRSGCRAKIPKALILRHFSLSDNHDNQYYKEKGNSKKIVSPDKEKRFSDVRCRNFVVRPFLTLYYLGDCWYFPNRQNKKSQSKNLSNIERNEVKQYGNEICRARYGTVFWNS